MNEIINALSYIMILFLGFSSGVVIGYLIFKYCQKEKIKVQRPQYSYCFQCEFEMPLKEKNGRTYCSNCGLLNFPIKEKCRHDIKVKKVLNTSATCETTAIFCFHCSSRLTEPEIEC